jgi:hypothetical protein
MYIYSVQAVLDSQFSGGTLTTADGVELKAYDYVLFLNQGDAKSNGVFMVKPDFTVERSSDFLMFGPHFEDFRISVIGGETYNGARYVLHVPLGSDFADLEQVYERNYDPDPSSLDDMATPARLQVWLDDFAKEKGYDDLGACVSYYNSANPVWAAEAARAVQLRDQAWAVYFANETLTWPELEPLLPVLSWE